jgi:hypothetical protein
MIMREPNQFWKIVSPKHQIIRDDHYMHSQNVTKESQNLITSQKQKELIKISRNKKIS